MNSAAKIQRLLPENKRNDALEVSQTYFADELEEPKDSLSIGETASFVRAAMLLRRHIPVGDNRGNPQKEAWRLPPATHSFFFLFSISSARTYFGSFRWFHNEREWGGSHWLYELVLRPFILISYKYIWIQIDSFCSIWSMKWGRKCIGGYVNPL